MTALLRAQPRHFEIHERPVEVSGTEEDAVRERERERDVAGRRDPLFKQFRLAHAVGSCLAFGISQHLHRVVDFLIVLF